MSRLWVRLMCSIIWGGGLIFCFSVIDQKSGKHEVPRRFLGFSPVLIFFFFTFCPKLDLYNYRCFFLLFFFFLNLQVLKLLIMAWDRRLIFTIGTSSTTGESDTVVWNEIHHKTEFGSNLTGHGYPDPNYLDNVLTELSAQGVGEDNLKDWRAGHSGDQQHSILQRTRDNAWCASLRLATP